MNGDDSSPLILGFVTASLQKDRPGLEAAGIRIHRIEPVCDGEGTIKAMRVHMGSGTYLCYVQKEEVDPSVEWAAVEAFSTALKAADPMVQQAFHTQTERWNELLWSLAHLLDKPYEGETDEDLIALLAKRLGVSIDPFMDRKTREAIRKVAREVEEEVIRPVTLTAGKRYVHPEDGEVEIIDGRYRDPVHDRVSNWWRWKVIETGEEKSGYGGHWEPVIDS